MKKEALAYLLGYFSSQEEIINELLNKIKKMEISDSSSEEKVIILGYLLHNLYCALEDLFSEIAKIFENQIEDPSKYHKELLKRVSIEIPKIRPKVISKESFKILDELRGFRHVFRHSYSYELDPQKVKLLRNKVLNNWEKILKDLENFKNFLKSHLE